MRPNGSCGLAEESPPLSLIGEKMDIDEILSEHPELKEKREQIKERKDFLDRFWRIEELLKSILQELKKLNSAFEKK